MVEEIDHQFYGKIKIFSNDEGICKHLKDGKTIWEEDLQKLFSKYYKGGSIIDVGAFIGLHTIAFSKICDKYVCAMEPQPETFSILKENTKDYDNIITWNLAISDCTGERYIEPININTSGNFGGVGSHEKSNERSIETRTFRIDDFTYGPVGLIKIDVEGHELAVLKGAEQTIKKWKPIIFIEILGGSTDPSNEEKKMIYETQEFICSLGYKLEKKVTVHDYIYIPR